MMKLHTILTLLVVLGVFYYWTDGDMMLGLKQPKDLPETVTAPNATFIGHEQSNPFVSP